MPRLNSASIYLAIMAVIVVAGLGFAEWGARAWGAYGGPNNSYLYKLYSDTRTDVVFGDSHVGNTDWLGRDVAFLGNGGMSLFEQLQAAKFYFRDKKPGKVMIETGPQLFSRVHDKTWRTLPPGTMAETALPIKLYGVEPLFVQGALNHVHEETVNALSSLNPVSHARAEEQGRTLRQAREVLGKMQRAGGSNFRFDTVPEWARALIIENLAHSYRPLKDFDDRVAWRSLTEMVKMLKAKGADICLVRAAISTDFEKAMLSGANEKPNRSTRRAVRLLARDNDLRYIDYRDLKARFPLSDFRNQDHLNTHGAHEYWESAYQACFNDNRAFRPTLRNAELRDPVMENRRKDGSFVWWNYSDKNMVLSQARDSFQRPVVDNRRSWQLEATADDGTFAFSKVLSVKEETDIVAGYHARVIGTGGAKGKLGTRITWFDASAKPLGNPTVDYAISELPPPAQYPDGEDSNWSGVVLRTKVPGGAQTARLEIFGVLDKGAKVRIDDAYLMSSETVRDITRDNPASPKPGDG